MHFAIKIYAYFQVLMIVCITIGLNEVMINLAYKNTKNETFFSLQSCNNNLQRKSLSIILKIKTFNIFPFISSTKTSRKNAYLLCRKQSVVSKSYLLNSIKFNENTKFRWPALQSQVQVSINTGFPIVGSITCLAESYWGVNEKLIGESLVKRMLLDYF